MHTMQRNFSTTCTVTVRCNTHTRYVVPESMVVHETAHRNTQSNAVEAVACNGSCTAVYLQECVHDCDQKSRSAKPSSHSTSQLMASRFGSVLVISGSATICSQKAANNARPERKTIGFLFDEPPGTKWTYKAMHPRSILHLEQA